MTEVTLEPKGTVSGRSRLTPEPRNRTAAAAGQMVGDSMRGPAGTAWRGRHGWQPRSSVRHWCNPIPPVFTAPICSGNFWARVSCDPVGRGGHPSPPRRRQWSPPADRRNQPRDLVNGSATVTTPWVDPPLSGDTGIRGSLPAAGDRQHLDRSSEQPGRTA